MNKKIGEIRFHKLKKLQMEHRELEQRIGKINSLMSKSATIKDCFHHNKEDCIAPIKNAHSLQRQGALLRLEKKVNGNAFLYTHTDRTPNKEHDFLDLKPVGRKKASTFFGFCDFHDTRLFSSIENDPEVTDINSDEHCFLHSYRSFAHSYHRKYEEVKLYNSDEPETRKLLIELHGKENLKEFKKYAEMALEDLAKPKKIIDHCMENKIYDRLEYLCIEYPYQVPVACASCTSPSHTFLGKEINISPDPNYIYSSILTTVIPLKERSVVILAAFPDEPHGSEFLDEIENIKYEIVQQKFLSYHLLNNAENTFIPPHYYDKKSMKFKKEYCHRIDFIQNNKTPHLKFHKKFPVNYFSESAAIKV